MAAFYYHPIAAYHRWLTGCLILPTITHFTQFFIRYPSNNNRKFGFWMMVFQHILGFIVACFFIYLTAISEKIYHFTAHHWDFNALIASKYLAFIIAFYSVIAFIIIPSWRIITDKERKKICDFLIFYRVYDRCVLSEYFKRFKSRRLYGKIHIHDFQRYLFYCGFFRCGYRFYQ
ncbi:hypothetical protein LEP1GSC150_4982 [Leptospira interrogans serovar Copenhageni str. LT2050]|uniref:Uncharacterized protein n=1 Tax=Leptospira interrogans serovar Copenhageni str. LT2050 TaxID=1001598 RepID=M3HSB9_LEPIT|nr:hypothetical protein LEP1GSC150_4982 [Leptospira interrogans serovar Copenhageni str. LT2050]